MGHKVPTALRVLNGNPSRRPLPEHEPQPDVDVADAPDWLPPIARAEWQRVAPMLRRVGVLTEADRDALTLYCQTWITWKDAIEHVRKDGLVVARRGKLPRQNPYLQIAERASAQLRRLLGAFGMTPESRSKVTAVTTKKQGKWDGLLS